MGDVAQFIHFVSVSLNPALGIGACDPHAQYTTISVLYYDGCMKQMSTSKWRHVGAKRAKLSGEGDIDEVRHSDSRDTFDMHGGWPYSRRGMWNVEERFDARVMEALPGKGFNVRSTGGVVRAENYGCAAEFRKTQSLRPGRPVPTHRYADAV